MPLGNDGVWGVPQASPFLAATMTAPPSTHTSDASVGAVAVTAAAATTAASSLSPPLAAASVCSAVPTPPNGATAMSLLTAAMSEATMRRITATAVRSAERLADASKGNKLNQQSGAPLKSDASTWLADVLRLVLMVAASQRISLERCVQARIRELLIEHPPPMHLFIDYDEPPHGDNDAFAGLSNQTSDPVTGSRLGHASSTPRGNDVLSALNAASPSNASEIPSPMSAPIPPARRHSRRGRRQGREATTTTATFNDAFERSEHSDENAGSLLTLNFDGRLVNNHHVASRLTRSPSHSSTRMPAGVSNTVPGTAQASPNATAILTSAPPAAVAASPPTSQCQTVSRVPHIGNVNSVTQLSADEIMKCAPEVHATEGGGPFTYYSSPEFESRRHVSEYIDEVLAATGFIEQVTAVPLPAPAPDVWSASGPVPSDIDDAQSTNATPTHDARRGVHTMPVIVPVDDNPPHTQQQAAEEHSSQQLVQLLPSRQTPGGSGTSPSNAPLPSIALHDPHAPITQLSLDSVCSIPIAELPSGRNLRPFPSFSGASYVTSSGLANAAGAVANGSFAAVTVSPMTEANRLSMASDTGGLQVPLHANAGASWSSWMRRSLRDGAAIATSAAVHPPAALVASQPSIVTAPVLLRHDELRVTVPTIRTPGGTEHLTVAVTNPARVQHHEPDRVQRKPTIRYGLALLRQVSEERTKHLRV